MKIKIMASDGNKISAKIIIIGATSGIGLALAQKYIKAGYKVGVTGRRLANLKQIQQQCLGQVYIKQMDVTHTGQAIIQFEDLIHKMAGVDIVVICAGVGLPNRRLNLSKEQQTIDINISGFTAIAGSAIKYFIKQRQGHLVNISSINAIRGSDLAPAYAASKAFTSNYMQGLRKKVSKLKLPIIITDIQPGFIETEMAKSEDLFWVSSLEKATRQIKHVIDKKRKFAYISKRWRLVAWFMKITPDWIWHKI